MGEYVHVYVNETYLKATTFTPDVYDPDGVKYN